MVGFAGASFVGGAGVAAAVVRVGLERCSEVPVAFLGASVHCGSAVPAGFAAMLVASLSPVVRLGLERCSDVTFLGASIDCGSAAPAGFAAVPVASLSGRDWT